MSGVSLATIKNIERGKGNPSFETVEKILAVLGMEILLKVRSPFDKQ
jgi:transcriptional regulator with XRE-family HTH domain